MIKRMLQQTVEAIIMMILAILFWVIVFDGILLEQERHTQKEIPGLWATGDQTQGDR